MRFLFGIFTGAALTLLVATTTNAPTSPLVKQITELWQDFITSTGDQLFRHRSEATATPGSAATAAERPVSEDPIIIEQPEESSSLPEPLIEDPIADTAMDALVAEAAAQLEDLGPQTSYATALPRELQLAAVWAPFHSERSANGFARNLSRHFAHPFNVQRTGPGTYQVTFAYADPAQREQMLSEIAELTGQ